MDCEVDTHGSHLDADKIVESDKEFYFSNSEAAAVEASNNDVGITQSDRHGIRSWRTHPGASGGTVVAGSPRNGDCGKQLSGSESRDLDESIFVLQHDVNLQVNKNDLNLTARNSTEGTPSNQLVELSSAGNQTEVAEMGLNSGLVRRSIRTKTVPRRLIEEM